MCPWATRKLFSHWNSAAFFFFLILYMSYVSFFFSGFFLSEKLFCDSAIVCFSVVRSLFWRVPLQTIEIAQTIESSLCKHEDLSLSHHQKAWWWMLEIPVSGRQEQMNPCGQANLFAEFQPNERLHAKKCGCTRNDSWDVLWLRTHSLHTHTHTNTQTCIQFKQFLKTLNFVFFIFFYYSPSPTETGFL